MTDCGFITATQAREKARNSTLVHSEICAIESKILQNVDAGLLTATVSTGTAMTDNEDYYKAYFNIVSDATKSDQITFVERHFTGLGYAVKIKENTGTGVNLIWEISW